MFTVDIIKNTTIRKIEEKDIKFLKDVKLLKNLIIQLTKENFCEDEIKQNVLLFVKNQAKAIFIAELEKKIIGFITLQIIKPIHLKDTFTRVLSLVVDENYRNKKVGTKLLQAAEIFAKENGCKSIELTSGSFRKNAHIFYEHRGYIKNQKTYFNKKI